jgi:RNA polymerase sigma-70 factor (ECF subfamily)
MSILNGNLERTYREHRQQLFTCALAITRHPERAEDAVHEAFCRLAQHTEAPRNLRVYVFRAVRNAAVDQLRRIRPDKEAVEEFIFDPGENPRESAEAEEFRRLVTRCLLSLPDEQRETIVEHLYGDLTFEEIAELRGSPRSTVASWYYRGLERLRAMLEGES